MLSYQHDFQYLLEAEGLIRRRFVGASHRQLNAKTAVIAAGKAKSLMIRNCFCRRLSSAAMGAGGALNGASCKLGNRTNSPQNPQSNQARIWRALGRIPVRLLEKKVTTSSLIGSGRISVQRKSLWLNPVYKENGRGEMAHSEKLLKLAVKSAEPVSRQLLKAIRPSANSCVIPQICTAKNRFTCAGTSAPTY